MGLLEVLTIIFVVCKLFGVIDWSWLLVLSPAIISACLYILVFMIYFFAARVERKGMKK